MTAKANHPAAVKVGGRRLSTSKHEHHKEPIPVEEPEAVAEATSDEPKPIDDYPRPAASHHEPAPNTAKANEGKI